MASANTLSCWPSWKDLLANGNRIYSWKIWVNSFSMFIFPCDYDFMYCFIHPTRYFIYSSFLVSETELFLSISCSTISFMFARERVMFCNSSRYFFIFYFNSLLSLLSYSNIFLISFFVFSRSSSFRLWISITIYWDADYWEL